MTAPAPASKPTILVVEDESLLSLALKVRLESRGYAVVTAANGQEALEAAARQRPDLVLLDVLMPVMDGYACLRELNARFGRGKLPVIVLTARDRMKDLFEVEGVADYIGKPFDHEDLLRRIEQVLSRRRPA